jgi:hypothetical protein
VRSILVSLACKYRWTLERLEAVSGRDVRRIHVIGGGAPTTAGRLTADLCGREVLAGPVEATALNNVLAGPRRRRARLARRAARGRCRVSEPKIHEPSGDGRPPALPGRHRPPSRGESIVTDVETPARAHHRDPVVATATRQRFGTFPSPAARATSSSVDDAAEVQRLTGTAGAVALHFRGRGRRLRRAARTSRRAAEGRRGQPEPVPIPTTCSAP